MFCGHQATGRIVWRPPHGGGRDAGGQVSAPRGKYLYRVGAACVVK